MKEKKGEHPFGDAGKKSLDGLKFISYPYFSKWT
jgi:hypothetical protein